MYKKISPIAAALTCAILFTLIVLSNGIVLFFYSKGQPVALLCADLYFGFKPSLNSILASTCFTFFFAGSGGYIAAFVYNLMIEYKIDQKIKSLILKVSE